MFSNSERRETLLANSQALSLTGSFAWRIATADFYWSTQMYRIFELDEREPLSLDLIGTRIHPEELSGFRERTAQGMPGDRDVQRECRLQMPDNSVKYIRIAAQSREYRGGLEYFGALQDVTEVKLAQQGLDRARSELARVSGILSLGTLAASIAHEVNQPLCGIINNSSACLRMLDADPPNIDGARRTVQRTIRDGTRASEVIIHLRALFGTHPAATEPVNMNEAAREVTELASSELQRHGVILTLDFADDLPPVTGDLVQLRQVVLNLVLNGGEAMSGVDDRPRELVIRTWREGTDHICVSVKDSGIGFALQFLDKLFEPYYTTKTGGMGIGLSVSRSIIESHRGHLWATPNEGPGSTFSFSLPLRETRVGDP